MTDDYTIKMNPRKSGMIKNTADGDIFFLEPHLHKQITDVIRYRCKQFEFAIVAWIAGGRPGAHLGELVMESHLGEDGPLGGAREVLRVRAGPYWGPGQGGAGPVLLELPPIKYRITEE